MISYYIQNECHSIEILFKWNDQSKINVVVLLNPHLELIGTNDIGIPTYAFTTSIKKAKTWPPGQDTNIITKRSSIEELKEIRNYNFTF